jgi:transcriptional regulator with XRE-family HTH domain
VSPALRALGANVRRLREQHAYTQEELAERSELHWTFVSGIERGIRNVSLLTLLRIAAALKVSLTELLHGVE